MTPETPNKKHSYKNQYLVKIHVAGNGGPNRGKAHYKRMELLRMLGRVSHGSVSVEKYHARNITPAHARLIKDCASLLKTLDELETEIASRPKQKGA